MEEHPNQLFSLSIDPVIKSHLNETARWGKFLSIVGFILCGLIVIMGFFFGSIFSTLMSREETYPTTLNPGALAPVMAVVYIIIAVAYFFPCLFLYRFSNKMKSALNGNDQTDLTLSFQNLKSLFRYVGVITVIILALYLIGFLVGFLGMAFAGR